MKHEHPAFGQTWERVKDAPHIDTDPTPPHGISRPAPIEQARLFISDSLSSCADWEDDAHPYRTPLETLSDALDTLEALVVFWNIGDNTRLNDLILTVAADLLWLTLCPNCERLTAGADESGCDDCREDEDEPECEVCGRTPAHLTADQRYTLCGRHLDQLTEERSRPQFPYRPGDDRRPDLGGGLLTATEDAPSPFGSALDD